MEYEFVIIGGGMVGLAIANQLIENNYSKNIIILDKESQLGLHSSGRNSGVLHAGIYYEPKSLKAKVCVEGSKRLKEWILQRNLSINVCGKVIVPQKLELDNQLDKLMIRGKENGAKVELIDKYQLKNICPYVNSSSGRAIWSPNTCVVNPKEVIGQLQKELILKKVVIKKNAIINNFYPDKKLLKLLDGKLIKYKYLINCAGVNADKISKQFGLGKDYKIIPFKGLYWKLKRNSPFKINTNLYPVPDLNIPFLGVHFTPNANLNEGINIGPTAVLAFGRENYKALEGIDLGMTFSNLLLLGKQYFFNNGGFRGYVNEQAFLSLAPLFLKAAQELIPDLKMEHIEISEKVGIRSQLFNLKKSKLENDFLCLNGNSSTHILNAISPAFTASFALADLIIEKYIKNYK